MNFKNLYTNIFSELKFGIQSSKIVYYNLCFDKLYGVQIVSKTETATQEDTMYISKDEDLVIDIIKYLYENSVDIALFRDIVDNLLVKIGLKKEQNIINA